jgi:uncharacterized BrkB/YihY/UPF0761 family membrane protein
MAYYFSNANPAFIYGVAAWVIMIFLWVSCPSMILVFGAKFMANYDRVYSGDVAPTEIA